MIALVAVGFTGLAGCATTGGFSVLATERDTQDELPKLDDHAYDKVDTSTSRYVGEHDGTSFWIAEGIEVPSTCLIAAADGSDWVVVCGETRVETSGVVGHFELLPDGAPSPENAIKVSENVYTWDD